MKDTRGELVLETIWCTCTVLTDCNCDLQLPRSFSDSRNLAQNKLRNSDRLRPFQIKWENGAFCPSRCFILDLLDLRVGGLLFCFILSKILALLYGPLSNSHILINKWLTG